MADFTEIFTRRRAPQVIEAPKAEGVEYCAGCKTQLYHAGKRHHRGAFFNGPEITVLIVTSLETEDTDGRMTQAVAARQTLRPVKSWLRNRASDNIRKTLADMLSETDTPYVGHLIEGNTYGEMHLYALMQTLVDTGADKVWACGCDVSDGSGCKNEKYCENVWVARTRMVDSPDAIVVQSADSHWRRVA